MANTEEPNITNKDNKVNPLSANIGIDFTLIGTKLHAVYEKKAEDGYSILLAPSEQENNDGVSIGELIEDIKSLVKGVDEKADTDSIESGIQSGTKGLSDGKPDFDLKNLRIKLQMAYLYIDKSSQQSVLEYAFQLQIITKDMLPKQLESLIEVDNVLISVWNTDRKKIKDKMALVAVEEYLK